MTGKHEFALKSLMAEAARLEKRIRIVRCHEEGLECAEISERVRLSVRQVQLILKEYGFKPNQDAWHLAEGRAWGKAGTR